MPNELPHAVATFVDATNRGDTEAFLAAFTADAVLNDWGREFTGREGIASWNITDNIGKQSHFDVVSVDGDADSDEVTVTLAVSGNGYNGTGSLRFRLRNGLIDRVDIT
jgi:ketosteroid isomerase-like protein